MRACCWGVSKGRNDEFQSSAPHTTETPAKSTSFYTSGQIILQLLHTFAVTCALDANLTFYSMPVLVQVITENFSQISS